MRLRDHLAVGQQPRADHLDLRQRRRGVEDPERRVVEVAARDEPLVGLVERRQRGGRGGQELELRVALADVAESAAEVGDRSVVRVEQPPLGQQRMHERVADRALDRLAKLRRAASRNAWTFTPSALRESAARSSLTPVVDGDEDQVDVGFGPDGVVRQAAAQNRGEDRPVEFHLLHQPIQGGLELSSNRLVHGLPSVRRTMILESSTNRECGASIRILAMNWMDGRLPGRVCVVTGASRGAGRGIACALGEAGATVYVTGRSVRGGPTTEDLPGTIEDTAEAVTARGGIGIAARCDHTFDPDVEAFFTRLHREQGRLDLLVNNAWGGYERNDYRKFSAPFHEQPLGVMNGISPAEDGGPGPLVATRRRRPGRTGPTPRPGHRPHERQPVGQAHPAHRRIDLNSLAVRGGRRKDATPRPTTRPPGSGNPARPDRDAL